MIEDLIPVWLIMFGVQSKVSTNGNLFKWQNLKLSVLEYLIYNCKNIFHKDNVPSHTKLYDDGFRNMKKKSDDY